MQCSLRTHRISPCCILRRIIACMHQSPPAARVRSEGARVLNVRIVKAIETSEWKWMLDKCMKTLWLINYEDIYGEYCVKRMSRQHHLAHVRQWNARGWKIRTIYPQIHIPHLLVPVAFVYVQLCVAANSLSYHCPSSLCYSHSGQCFLSGGRYWASAEMTSARCMNNKYVVYSWWAFRCQCNARCDHLTCDRQHFPWIRLGR